MSELQLNTTAIESGASEPAAVATPILELKNLSKSYGSGSQATSVLKNINLRIAEGEFVAIVGFSGSGKTTLISLIAGLIAADSGAVLLHGKPVEGPGAERGVVFQSYSLMPWMTVRQNVALAVDQFFKDTPKAQRAARVEKYVAMVNLTAAIDQHPAELSGGMQQRVNLARALATDPEVLLMDEPFAALDAQTREFMQAELLKIWTRAGKTVIFITHQIDEAVFLADRVVVMGTRPGRLKGEFAIPFARPRALSIKRDPEFLRLSDEIWSLIEEEAGRINVVSAS